MYARDTHRTWTLRHCRPSIHGMKLIAETHHRKYGSAVYAKPTLDIEEVHTKVTDSQIELITVSLAKITITSVYKPPSKRVWMAISTWMMQTAAPSCNRWLQLAQYCMGLWLYEQNDCNGDRVEAWAEASNFSLIHDAKVFWQCSMEERIQPWCGLYMLALGSLQRAREEY